MIAISIITIIVSILVCSIDEWINRQCGYMKQYDKWLEDCKYSIIEKGIKHESKF